MLERDWPSTQVCATQIHLKSAYRACRRRLAHRAALFELD
jgi:hypothetical protein